MADPIYKLDSSLTEKLDKTIFFYSSSYFIIIMICYYYYIIIIDYKFIEKSTKDNLDFIMYFHYIHYIRCSHYQT